MMSRNRKRLPAYSFDNIPKELQKIHQWVNWKYEERNGKQKKPPISPFSGRPAKTTDPTSWNSLENALGYLKKHQGRGIDGIGFVFTFEDTYCGVDIDNCRDPKTGELKPFAQEIISSLKSYTEISPSGKGVHIIFQSKLPGRGRKNPDMEIEVYDRNRYFTITGSVLDGFDTIHGRQAELEALLKKYFDSGLVKGTVQAPPTPSLKTANKLSDQELIQKAISAKNGKKFKRLWSGDLSDRNGDHSGGDMALCQFLAYWTNNDPAKIDRLFRKSKLFRPKWDEVHNADGNTYGEMTIQRAIGWNQKDHKRDNGLKYFSARDLLNTDFPEPKWAIEGLLPEGLTILASKPKQGKSIFALNIGIAVANGTQALKRFGTEKGTVICFALEDTYRRLQKRLLKMLPSGMSPPEKLILSDSLKTVDKGGIETLHKYLKEFPDTVLVIIDTLALFRSHNKRSTNIYDADYQEISPIKSIADEKGIAILIIHHMRKSDADDIMDTFSGTLGLT